MFAHTVLWYRAEHYNILCFIHTIFTLCFTSFFKTLNSTTIKTLMVLFFYLFGIHNSDFWLINFVLHHKLSFQYNFTKCLNFNVFKICYCVFLTSCSFCQFYNDISFWPQKIPIRFFIIIISYIYICFCRYTMYQN